MWDKIPVDPEVSVERFEADARRIAKDLHRWFEILEGLIVPVENWVREFGWSTKRIDKPMEDSEVGKYTAPALLMQEETTKVLLEPIARSTPGSEGVVDLYLMPGYDDIASFYYQNDRWHLHYLSAEQKAARVAWKQGRNLLRNRASRKSSRR